MKTRFISIIVIIALTILATGCATPLGRQYGTVGTIGGAAIGGALGGWEGAFAGAAAGGIAGGLLGDQQQFRGYRNGAPYPDDGYQYGRRGWGGPGNYGNGGYPYSGNGGYVRPCNRVNVSVYDSWGNVVGYRTICQ